mmetsp:Transcript_14931/g.25328  ORF Transcript_14931/g.25328 Transcript_14931/m.25328 type:complete len:152 (+) Transcript_14931:91-546(+)
MKARSAHLQFTPKTGPGSLIVPFATLASIAESSIDMDSENEGRHVVELHCLKKCGMSQSITRIVGYSRTRFSISSLSRLKKVLNTLVALNGIGFSPCLFAAAALPPPPEICLRRLEFSCLKRLSSAGRSVPTAKFAASPIARMDNAGPFET